MNDKIILELDNISDEDREIIAEIIKRNTKWKDEYPYNDPTKSLYYLCSNGHIAKAYGNHLEEEHLIGNIYKTKAEAEKAREKKLIYYKLKRYADYCWRIRNINPKNIWNATSLKKYTFEKDPKSNFIRVTPCIYKQFPGLIYFPTEQSALQAIDIIGKENILKLFEYTEN